MPLFLPFARRRLSAQPAFWTIYVLSVVFNFHSLLVAYSNSSYMERFTTPEVIGMLYTIGSALAVLAFLCITWMLRIVGNVTLTLWLALIEILSLVVLGAAFGSATTIVAFVVFITINPLLYLTLDIFSETLIGEGEHTTGSKRGLTLALMSLAAMLGPLTLALIVGDDATRLHITYFVSAAVFSTFILIILAYYVSFKDPVYPELNIKGSIKTVWNTHNVRIVCVLHFTLQVFFSWMIIYVPLYLTTEIGFAWDEVGSIFAAGLFAYVLFEYPIGIWVDRENSEKTLMAMGFVILIITTAAISFLSAASVIIWMALMFVSRIGASLVEVTTESYFFKQIKGSDANTISFFRLTRPLAMICGSLLGSVALLYLPFSLIFIILSIAMLPALYLTQYIPDY